MLSQPKACAADNQHDEHLRARSLDTTPTSPNLKRARDDLGAEW